MAEQTQHHSKSSDVSSKPEVVPSVGRENRRDLRIPGLPSVNLSATTALIGTPYATSQGPPFEYPFPSPASASPTGHGAYPPVSPGGHTLFPFAPSLVAQGANTFTNGRMHIGLALPMFKRTSIPPPSKPNRPPVPPSLKEKAREKKASQTSSAAK